MRREVRRYLDPRESSAEYTSVVAKVFVYKRTNEIITVVVTRLPPHVDLLADVTTGLLKPVRMQLSF